MTDKALQNEKEIQRFLLGAMSEDERAAFELRFIADEDWFEQTRVVEDELIESYIRGTLDSTDKTNFENYFLSTETRRRKVDFTRRMLGEFKNQNQLIAVKKIEAAAENPSVWNSLIEFFKQPKFAFGAAFAVLLLIFAAWFLSRNPQTNEIAKITTPIPIVQPSSIVEPNQNQAVSINQNAALNANETSNNKTKVSNANRNAANKNENANSQKSVRNALAPTLALFAGLSRAEGKTAELVLPENASGANLQLNLESRDYKIYQVEIADADGKMIYQNKRLRAAVSKINFYVPAAKLQRGDYLVKLSAFNSNNENESVADYAFRVKRP